MSGLRFSGESAAVLGTRLIREGDRTSPRALRHMRRVGRSMLKTAVAYSPVDYKGKTRKSEPLRELERSHRLVEKVGDSRRIEVMIEVGGMVGDVNVDKYAVWIHEGGYERGPATIAKGPKAGPHWLERTLEEHEDDFEEFLDEIFEGIFE